MRLIIAAVLIAACRSGTTECGSFEVCKEKQCPGAPSTPGDRRTDKNRLVISSFNVEWLFDNVDDNGRGTAEGVWDGTGATASLAEHSKAVAAAIQELDPTPDVLLLQEVEHCGMLLRLVEEMRSAGSAYRGYLVKGADYSTGQNVALLTKVDPVQPLVRIAGRAQYPLQSDTPCDKYKTTDKDTAVTKNFYAKLLVSGHEVHLVNMHLKSGFGGGGNSCAQRQAQAAVVASFVKAEGLLSSSALLVVAGDMNDRDGATPDAKAGVSRTRDFDSGALEVLRGSVLSNAAAAVPQSKRFTYGRGTASTREMIDHLLVSPALAARQTSATIANERAFEDAYHDTVSGHYAVVAAFDMGGEVAAPVAAPVVAPVTVPLLCLNTASGPDLEALPGIGESKAAAIVTNRELNGPFASVDDLTRVSGVGGSTLQAVRAEVTVECDDDEKGKDEAPNVASTAAALSTGSTTACALLLGLYRPFMRLFSMY